MAKCPHCNKDLPAERKFSPLFPSQSPRRRIDPYQREQRVTAVVIIIVMILIGIVIVMSLAR